MTSFARSFSPLDRLALAVTTEPRRADGAYRPTSAVGREEAMRGLLQTAADTGISLIATRPDGDDERLLGQAWPFPSPFQVTVRSLSLSEGLDRVEARARRSLERLGLPRGEALLISSAGELAGAEGRDLWARAQALKDRGLFRRIGFCARIEDRPSLLAQQLKPDVVQIGCNLLDQRAARDGTLEAIAGCGAAVHLTSVFAGGALFEAGDPPPRLADHALALSRTRRRLAEMRCDPMQAALVFAFSLPGVEKVVANVGHAAELRAVLAAAHAPRPDVDWSMLALEAPAAFTADARRRISSAA